MNRINNLAEIKVSFVLPAYKGAWIRQAIDSILAQTHQNIELIIINDQSPDNIEAVVTSYSDPRIRYYINEKNIGGKNLVKQWEHCIQFAEGNYLVMAADDDIYNPDFTLECLKMANKYPETDIVRARTQQIDENGNLIGIDSSFPEYINQLEYIYRYRDGSAFICIGNFLFKAAVLKEKGFIDFPMALGSDIATSIIMAENGMATTETILFSFRQSSVHLSGSKTRFKERIEAITLFFSWIKTFNYPNPKNEYDNFFLKHLTNNDWDEKCTFDYYNQVIKHLPIYKIYYLKYTKNTSVKNKIKMIVRRIKDIK